MDVLYTKTAGKNWGLHFNDVDADLRDRLVGFVTYNTQWRDAPYTEITKLAGPFIQSDEIGNSRHSGNDGKASGYLFIEFWSEPEKHADFVNKVAEEFCLDIKGLADLNKTANIIAEVDFNGKTVTVEKQVKGDKTTFNVCVNGDVKHPNCDADSAIRALAHYLHGSFKGHVR